MVYNSNSGFSTLSIRWERAGSEFNIYVSRLSGPGIQPCGLCTMSHSPQTVLTQLLASVLTDVNIFMWKLCTLEMSPTNVALNHVFSVAEGHEFNSLL
jgi:hypothetical protein